MKVVIDEELCHGHGRCYMLAPDVFDADDRGHGLVLLDSPPAEVEEKARLAAANCPEHAISVTE